MGMTKRRIARRVGLEKCPIPCKELRKFSQNYNNLVGKTFNVK